MIDLFLFAALLHLSKSTILAIIVYLLGIKWFHMGVKTCLGLAIFLPPLVLSALWYFGIADSAIEVPSDAPKKGIVDGLLVDALWMVAFCSPFTVIGVIIARFGIMRIWK